MNNDNKKVTTEVTRTEDFVNDLYGLDSFTEGLIADNFANIPLYVRKEDEEGSNHSIYPNILSSPAFAMSDEILFSDRKELCHDDNGNAIRDYHEYAFNNQRIQPTTSITEIRGHDILCAQIANKALFETRAVFLVQEKCASVVRQFEKLASNQFFEEIIATFFRELRWDSFDTVDSWIDSFREKLDGPYPCSEFVSPYIDITAMQEIIGRMSTVIATNMYNVILRHNVYTGRPIYSHKDIFDFIRYEAQSMIYDIICCIINEFLYIYKPASLSGICILDAAPKRGSKCADVFLLSGGLIHDEDPDNIYKFNNSQGEVDVITANQLAQLCTDFDE